LSGFQKITKISLFLFSYHLLPCRALAFNRHRRRLHVQVIATVNLSGIAIERFSYTGRHRRSSLLALPVSESHLHSASHVIDRCPASGFLMDIFLSDRCSGAFTSVFSNDIGSLQNALACHDIDSCGLSIEQCRHALLYHLLSGACVNYNMDANQRGRRRPDRATCRNFSVGIKSADELACVALNVVLTADANLITTDRLFDVVSALGFDNDDSNNRRRRYQAFLKNKLRKLTLSIEKGPQSPSPSSAIPATWDIFCSFESLPKGSLVALAAAHRLQLPRRVTAEQL
jgi:hypothetical protein